MLIKSIYFPVIVLFSVLFNLLVIFVSKKLKLGIDHRLNGKHNIHKKSVPRLGGVAVFLTLLIGLLFWDNVLTKSVFFFMAVAVFLLGLIEDIFRNISPRVRFVLIALIAFLTVLLSSENVVINDIGIVKLPYFISIIFTVFAITGIVNSINITDGINGLSSGISLIASGFMLILSYENQHYDIFNFLFIFSGSLFGFFIVNFFTGKIFLGDGGAYFTGFILALFSVMLDNRCNGDISPWFFVVLLAYPIFDTLFSMYRRRVKGKSSIQADFLHMHTLLCKRLLRCNYKAVFFILITIFVFSYLGFIFKSNTTILISLFCIFSFIYTLAYFNIVKFSIKR